MPRLRRIPVVVSLAAVAALGAQSALSTAATTKSISVKDDFFSPKNVTISKGTRVTWRWTGDSDHNVKSTGTKKFKSSTLKDTGTHKVTFTKTGTYNYECTLHDGMTGRIKVN